MVTAFDLPDGVRVDTGVGVGSTVSPFYDSLLAKVIAHGADRSSAIATLVDALDATRIEGVATNVDLLAAVLDEPAFRAGDLHTGFLDEHRVAARLARRPRRGDRRRGGRALARRAAGQRGRHRRARPVARRRPVAPGPGRRAAALDRGRARADDPDLRGAGGRRRDGHDRRQRDRGEADGRRRPVGLDARDRPDTALVRQAVAGSRVETVTWSGRRHRLMLAPPPSDAGAAAVADTPDALTAPMPGRIVRIHVEAGAHVREHTPLVILEAMKMEHVIAASAPGRVARVHVAVGDQVQRGALLVDLEAAEPAAGDTRTAG